MPTVSVIVPTFGRAELACRAVRSVLAQTLTDLQVIVVVDGDDPETLRQLSLLSDDRVSAIRHTERRGAGRARNTGVDHATAIWVAFLDDDDEWLPGKLEAQLAASAGERSILMTLSRVVISQSTFIRPADPYEGDMPVDEWLFDRRT